MAATYSNPQQQQQGPRRPPRKIPYKDGISTSPQQYDLYEMIRRPNLHPSRRAPDAPPYENKREKAKLQRKKLEGEVEEKFEHRSVSKRAIITFLGTLIKVFFLAFILPPYLILYKAPKWIFTDLIPRLCNRIKMALMARYKTIKHRIDRVILKLIAPYIKMKKMWKRLKLKEQNIDVETEMTSQSKQELSFLAFILQGVWICYKWGVNPLFRLVKWMYKSLKKANETTREMPYTLDKFLRKQIQKRQKQACYLVEKGVELEKKSVGYLRDKYNDKIANPISNWCAPKAEAIKRKVIAAVQKPCKKAVDTAEAIKNWVLHPVETAKAYCRSIQKRLNEHFAKLKQAILASIETKRTAMKQIVDSQMKRIVAPFHHIYQAVKKNILKTVAFYERLKQVYLRATKSLRKLPNDTIKKYVSMKALKKAALKDRLENYRLFMHNRKAILAQRFNQWMDPIKQSILKKWRTVKAVKEQTTRTLSVKSQRILLPIKMGTNQVKVWCRLLLLRGQLLRAWGVVLFRYGMHIVRETADSFGRKASS